MIWLKSPQNYLLTLDGYWFLGINMAINLFYTFLYRFSRKKPLKYIFNSIGSQSTWGFKLISQPQRDWFLQLKHRHLWGEMWQQFDRHSSSLGQKGFIQLKLWDEFWLAECNYQPWNGSRILRLTPLLLPTTLLPANTRRWGRLDLTQSHIILLWHLSTMMMMWEASWTWFFLTLIMLLIFMPH